MPKRQLVGVVTSDKMEKTVTVSLVRRYAHPVYGKQVTRTKTVKARNEHRDLALTPQLVAFRDWLAEIGEDNPP